MRPSARFSETTSTATTIAFIAERSPDSVIADYSYVANAIAYREGPDRESDRAAHARRTLHVAENRVLPSRLLRRN